ncbi:MAG: FAD-binding oxidoreductase [Dehalococcoidia bacterium]|nr:FAD-binding oxidoreductase [Dehalococcoidia bacterium]
MTTTVALARVCAALPVERYLDVTSQERGHPGYQIADRLPSIAVRPESAEEVALLLDVARADSAAVVPVGAHTAMTLGRPLSRYDVALDMLGLDRIIEYEPADMTVTVEAGVRLADLQARLQQHGQYLSVDPPPGDEVTIGGLLATARSGAWRGHLPAARDLILGLTVAQPDGALASSGGRVVKNVTGYDLHRLYTGALGALGVIVRASFKVTPLPEATVTVALACADLEIAERVALGVWDRRLPLRALTILDARTATALAFPTAATVLIEVADVTAAVERADHEISDVASAKGATRLEVTNTIWSALRRHADSDDRANHALLRLGVPPSAVRATLEVVAAHGLQGWAHLAAGSVLALGEDPSAATIEALRAYASNVGGFLQVESPTAALASTIDPFGAGDIELTRALKSRFDPTGVLNPGRWAEGV